MTQKYQVKVSMKQAAIVETGIVLKQGDFGMQIEIEVLDFDATGTTPQIVFRKAMGAVESTTITVSNNKYTYTFRGTELDTPGKVFCDLKLKNSTTQRISTASFMFKVVADTLDGLAEESSSYSDTIAQIVGGFDEEIESIENAAKDTNIDIDTLASSNSLKDNKWVRGTIYNTGWDNNNSFARTEPRLIGDNDLTVYMHFIDDAFKAKIIYVSYEGDWTFKGDTPWKTTDGEVTLSKTTSTHYIVVLTINQYSGNIWDGQTALVDFNEHVTISTLYKDKDIASLKTRMTTAETNITNLQNRATVFENDTKENIDTFVSKNLLMDNDWVRGTIYNTGWDNNNSFARTEPRLVGDNDLTVNVHFIDHYFKAKLTYVSYENGNWVYKGDTGWKTTDAQLTVSKTTSTHYIIVLTLDQYSGNIWDGQTALIDFNEHVTISTLYKDKDITSLETRTTTAETNITNLQMQAGDFSVTDIYSNSLQDTSNSKILAKSSLSWKATDTGTWKAASYLSLEIAAAKGDVIVCGALYMDSLSQQMLHIIEYNNDTQLSQLIVPKMLDSSNRVYPIKYQVKNDNTNKVVARFGIRYNGQSSGYPDVVVGQTYYIRNAFVLSEMPKFSRQEEFLYDLPTNWESKTETIKIAQGQKFIFGVQTDTHFRMRSPLGSVGVYNTWLTQCRNISKLTDKAGLDFICNLGDIIHGYADPDVDNTDVMREAYNEVLKRYLQFLKCPLFMTLGNHDDNNMYATAQEDPSLKIPTAEQYARAILPAKNTMSNPVFNGRSTYYYQDFEDSNIRVIVLDSCGESIFTISNTQLTWFTNIALDTTKAVILMTHVPLVDEITSNDDVVGNREYVMAALSSFKANGGTVIGCFYGHTHQQDSATKDGILHVTFKDGGDVGEVVMIDTTNKTINTITLGFDSNRSFTYT